MLSQTITTNEVYTILWEELQNYKTYIKIREKVSCKLKLELDPFAELEAFPQFTLELD